MLAFIIYALVIAALLPALGLIHFVGGVWSAIFATIVVGICVWLAMAFMGWFLGFVATITGVLAALLTDGVGVLLIPFIFDTLVAATAIWLAAHIGPGIVLISFWHTIGAGAILSLVELFV